MLELQHIAWALDGGKEILRDISIQVPEGKLVVATGPNGGGKTSLAKIVAGLETPTAGRILLDGEDITGLDVTQRAQRGISFGFQQPVRFKGITVRDLMELGAGRALDSGELCELLGKVGLCAPEYQDRGVDAGLSGGEIKRIEIASVLARDTKLTIFDEPEAGIDLWSFSGLVEVFKKLKGDPARASLIISHQERILEIADEIVVVADGRVRTAGPREQVLPELMSGEKAGRCPLGKEDALV